MLGALCPKHENIAGEWIECQYLLDQVCEAVHAAAKIDRLASDQNPQARSRVTDANGEDIEKDIPFVGGYTVFNADQIDGLPAEYYGKDELVAAPARDERCEAFFNATGADIRHGGTRAFYNPGGDFIQMPPAAAFKSMDRYYGTLAHEAIHWTAHTKRLDRKFGARFGDNAYAAEEMVAEIGAAFWCAMMGIATDESIRDDHAAYVGSWIATLKNDRKAIFTAASKASAAIEYLDKPVA